MTTTGGPVPDAGAGDALARATRALQDEPQPGWPDLALRVSRSVRTVSRPGRPLTMDDSGAGVLRVHERVVVDAVRRAVTQVPDCRPVGASVGSEAGELTRLVVELWVGYGEDLVAVAAAARAAATAAMTEMFGRSCPVDVTVVDIEVSRPRTAETAGG